MKGVVTLAALPCAFVGAHKVGAIYFGHWHPTEINDALHGPGWTEWNLVKHATPRFPGHQQPVVPLDNVTGFGPSHPENNATNMAAKIDAAKNNGMDFFMFDWYWFAHPMLNKKGYGTWLAGALEDGFLKAPNNEDMEFCLMWANQDWVDIHPAKKSWHNCYRHGGPAPNPPLQPAKSASELLVFDGYLDNNLTIAQEGLDYVVDTYFSKRNYLRVPTLERNSDGTTSVKQCCYFAFYQLEYLLWGFGEKAAAAQLDRFKTRTAEQGARNPDACQCVHLSSMQGHPGATPLSGKMDGFGDYGWVKTVQASTFPVTPYEEIIEAGVKKWDQRTSQVAPALYVPPINVGFDSSPRTLPQDGWGNWGYPWTPSYRSTPAQWKSALEQAKAYLDRRCSDDFDTGIAGLSGAEYCPPFLINAWNEWSEGTYLEPDEQNGFAKMEAIGQVFSKSHASSKKSVSVDAKLV